jgi:RNA polymerase sigma factor (sigma-70 family)
MSSNGSVTHWLDEIRRGVSTATDAIWRRYYPDLVRLARQKLRDAPCGVADEEDVALSAMDSFFDAAQQGRFPDVADRRDLWRLLLRITARKVVDLKRRELRQRRGGGRVKRESALGAADPDDELAGLAAVIGDVPTPEFAAMVAEEYRRLLERLADPDLEALAVAKMEGYTNREIAQRFNCSVRSIERRLRLIRKKWEQEPPP